MSAFDLLGKLHEWLMTPLFFIGPYCFPRCFFIFVYSHLITLVFYFIDWLINKIRKIIL